jgi:hypothetical protein
MDDIINKRLTKCEEEKIQELTIGRQKATERFKNFLKDHEDDLDQETTFELLKAHGRLEDTLQIAHDRGNDDFVVRYYINNAKYECALEGIVSVKDEKKKRVFMEQYLCVLIANLPEPTFRVLANKFRLVNVTGIITSLNKINKKTCELVLEYLRSVKDRTEDKLVHNMYLLLLVMHKDYKQELLSYITNQERIQRAARASSIDVEFAIDACKHFNQEEPLIYIYAMNGYYEEAVKVAIKLNRLDLAETYANLTTDDFIKKMLWIEIAKNNLVEEQANMNVLNKCKLLNLADILQFVPPKVKLNVFRKNLMDTLKEHDAKLDKIYTQAKEYGRIFKKMYKKTSYLINKSIKVDGSQLCANCSRPLLGSERVFVFPCTHGFHMVLLLNNL